jgi:hypothetical protein
LINSPASIMAAKSTAVPALILNVWIFSAIDWLNK